MLMLILACEIERLPTPILWECHAIMDYPESLRGIPNGRYDECTKDRVVAEVMTSQQSGCGPGRSCHMECEITLTPCDPTP